MPTTYTRDDLSPALTYMLMMGQYPPGRVHGWVTLMMIPLSGVDRHVRAAWAQHGDRLTADAAAWGFTPAGVSARGPRGSVRAWAKQWLATYDY